MKQVQSVQKKPNKRKKWIYTRHYVIRIALGWAVRLFLLLAYGLKIEAFREQGKRQYLIIMNHQTGLDQFFSSLTFKRPVYYLATEDIFSKGWISSLLRWAVAPIPIKKQTTDVRAVMNCIQVAKEGGIVALAPEGNRTYSGRTVYIKPSILKLVRALKLPLAIYRIEGGYGIQPRWSDCMRRGPLRAYVSRVVEPEEYAAMSDDELHQTILDELYVDENAVTGEYRHKNLAEYMERLFYVCPFCGLSEFESHGDITSCKNCGKQIRYLPSKKLEGVNCDFPFTFAGEWYDYQCNFVNKLNPTDYCATPMYKDKAQLSEVILYKNKRPLLDNADIELYGDRIIAGDQYHFPFSEASSITVLGRNKLNIYFDGKVYQLKGSKRFNAIKYMNLYYRYKNVSEGCEDGKFLGL